MYLLDTNIVSILAPARRQTAVRTHVAKWIVERSSDLWLSVVTALEVEYGIANAFSKGAVRKAANLAEWWGETRHYYYRRILPIDLAVAAETGRLMDVARHAGISPGFEDLAIAATGRVHDLIVLTANGKDFRPLGVAFQNPLEKLPD